MTCSEKNAPKERLEGINEKEAFLKHLPAVVNKCKYDGKYFEQLDLEGDICGGGKRLVVDGDGYEDAYAVISVGNKVVLIDCKQKSINERGIVCKGRHWIIDEDYSVSYTEVGEFCYSASKKTGIPYLKAVEGSPFLTRKENKDEFFGDFSMFHEVEMILKKILAK